MTQQTEVSNGESTVKKLKAPFKKIVKEEIWSYAYILTSLS